MTTTDSSTNLRRLLDELESIGDASSSSDEVTSGGENTAHSLRSALERLDELIRTDKTARASIDDHFYSVLLHKLTQTIVTSSSSSSSSLSPRWLELSLVVKCLKNSAGVFRERFSSAERDLCTFLLDKLDLARQLEHSDTLDTNNNNFKFNSYLYLLQYVFNLIQGNKEAYETNMEKWSLTCFSVLRRPNLRQDFYDLASMILIYGCVEKKSSNSSYRAPNLTDAIYTSQLTLEAYLNLLDRLCAILAEKNYDFDDLIEHEQMHFWSFKFVDFYFNHIYSRLIDRYDSPSHDLLPVTSRGNFFSLLNYRILHLDHDSNGRDEMRRYLARPSLELIVSSFITSSSLLIDLVDRNGDTSELHAPLRESKLLANTLADLLTVQEGVLDNDQIEANIRLAQSNEALFRNVCELFRRVHSDSEWWKSGRVKEESRSGSTTIKCELVRLIGILVFENELNQNYLVENRLVYILSENLDVDVDNPFLREWSIIALRHVLCAHDRKL